VRLHCVRRNVNYVATTPVRQNAIYTFSSRFLSRSFRFWSRTVRNVSENRSRTNRRKRLKRNFPYEKRANDRRNVVGRRCRGKTFSRATCVERRKRLTFVNEFETRRQRPADRKQRNVFQLFCSKCFPERFRCVYYSFFSFFASKFLRNQQRTNAFKRDPIISAKIARS